MGYQQGLSGLSASASDLDVIGNNIANANTVGFKQGNAQFADMYANSLATAVNNQIGIGTMQSEVQQDFSQGSINSTGQALNVAINGNGFYQMSNNGATTYSRNGVFHLTSDGNVVNAQGLKLMGYAADPSGVVNTASTVPLTIPTTNISPKATTSVAAQLNLDSQATPPSDPTFSPTDSNTYNFSTSVQTYDSLGGTEQLNMYFVKSPTAGTWNVYAGPNGGATSNLGTMTFNSAGTLTNPANGQFAFSMPTADGSTTPEPITLNFSGTTQYGGASGINNLKPDGYAAGQLSNFSIGQDGTITGNYSNGQTTALGQIVLANFNNPNGLLNLGGNEFQQTAASGTAQVSAPGATNHGTLTGGAVEESNVDLTNQLVNLITAQRNYQANAQTIKTQQTVDQTLLQL